MVEDSRAPLRPGALRSLGEPRSLAVSSRPGPEGEDVPIAVAKRRSAQPHWQPVERVEECWRVEDGWWRERPTSRRYFRLLLAGGVVLTLFQDLTNGRWYAQTY